MPAASGIRAGKAFVEVGIRDEFTKPLNRFGKRLQSAAMGAGRLGSQLLAVSGAASIPFINAVRAASDMEETMSKFNTVFRDNAKEVRAWGDTLGAQVGRSQKQIASFLAESQDLFVPLGFDRSAATDLSKTVTQLSIDLASFNNMADDDVMRDLKAALTGSSEVMKKYGVIVNETAVAQELLNQGIKKNDASEQQKALARLAIIMRGTTDAQGDATRTAGSFANQMKRLQATVANFNVTVGAQLIGFATEFVGKATDIIGRLTTWAKENKELVVRVVKLVAVVGGVGAALVAVGAVLGGLGAVVSGLAAGLGVLVSVVGAVGSAFVAIATGPIGAVVAGIALGTAVAYQFSEGVRQMVNSVGRYFGDMFGRFNETFGSIVNALISGDLALAGKIAFGRLEIEFLKIKDAVLKIWGELTAGLKSMFNEAMAVVQKTTSDVTTGFIQGLTDVNKEKGLVTKKAADAIAKETSERNEKFKREVDERLAQQREASKNEVARNDAKRNERLQEIKNLEAELQAQQAQANKQGKDAKERFLKLFSGESNQAPAGQKIPEVSLPDLDIKDFNAKKVRDEVQSLGTFSSFAAQRIGAGGDSAAERQVDLAQEANDKLEQLITLFDGLRRALSFS